MASCSVITELTWLICFPYAPKKSSMQWHRNLLQTFSTIWKHSFTAEEYVSMDQDSCPYPLQKKTLNKSMPWFWIIDWVLLTLFGNAQGIIVEHYWESGTTVNRVHFSEMFWEQLKPAVWTNAEDCCWKVWCSTITSVCILPPKPLKAFTNWT
jgi:hypothetical protein